MANSQPTVWGIHAGRSGEVDSVFLKGYIAVGWSDLGDLAALPADREAFKARFQQVHPDFKPGAIPVQAGALYRLVHEMRIGDLVAYPSKQDRLIHIGKITGPYKYDPKLSQHYAHIRPVKWLSDVPRTSFTQGALYEIGSAITLFLIRSYADEFIAAASGKEAPLPMDADPTVGPVTARVVESTEDFIIKRLSQELKGHPFADFVAHLLGTMGYRSRVSRPGPDGGVDIIAHKDELGFEPPIVRVQVKSTSGSVGAPDVQALYGTLTHGEYALLVTLGTFTPQARVFATSKSNLRLVDGADLANLVLDHYEQFDSRYKSLIPLKRIYVPEALESEVE